MIAVTVTVVEPLLLVLLSIDVVNVAELPVKTIVDVLPVATFSSVRLYVTVYVSSERLVELIVTTDPEPAHTVVAEGTEKLLTLGFGYTGTITFCGVPVHPAAVSV